MEPIRAVQWSPAGDALRIIDQRLLPDACVERDLRTVEDVTDAIRTLAVRGAPAIGVAAAIGVVASLLPFRDDDPPLFRARLHAHAALIAGTRPTAVNLAWALRRMMDAAEAERSGLVSRVVPLDQLMTETLGAALMICSYSQLAVMAAKESVNRAFESGLADGVMFERRMFHALFGTADQKEGMDAFVNKRPAAFKHG